MISAWENSDNKSKSDLKRKFELELQKKKSLNEKEIFKKFSDSGQPIKRENNKSLDYFFVKLGL
jgi:hypothetical protein